MIEISKNHDASKMKLLSSVRGVFCCHSNKEISAVAKSVMSLMHGCIG